MNTLLANLQEKFNIIISKSRLRNILKDIGFVWKRAKKSLRNDRDQEDFEKAQKDIEVFEDMHKRKEIKLCYFDGAHFSLTPSVPYAWQEKGHELELPSKKGGTQNVLGLMTPDQEFKSFSFETKINSETVIFAFDEFFKYKRNKEKVVIILDNAPVHKSDEFQEAIKRWKNKNIFFYFLPPYSPELNKIEILWRFIKYSWLPLDSYLNKLNLADNLFYILKNIGDKYRITFS
mgnify:CR=1 FL=1